MQDNDIFFLFSILQIVLQVICNSFFLFGCQVLELRDFFFLFLCCLCLVICVFHEDNGDIMVCLKQEMIRLMREKRFPAAFKCYHNLHKVDSVSSDNLFYKMVIHVHSDSAFRRYQKEMRSLISSTDLLLSSFLQ